MTRARAWRSARGWGLGLLALLTFPGAARAQIDNAGVLDKALSHFRTAAEGWEQASLAAASSLFWSLAVISLVWTMGQLALKRTELGEVFAELIRYLVFTGFWAFMLEHGPQHARMIVESMQRLGGAASGRPTLSPSRLVDIGFHLLERVMSQSSILSPGDSAVATALALVILVILALVAVNMLVLLVSVWFVAYGGLIILGFGGCRWTHDMAIHYYRMVLSLGLQVLAMALLVGAGQGLLESYVTAMGQTDVSLHEQAVLLVVAIMLLCLVNRVPPLLGSLANSSSPQYALGSGAGTAAALAAASTAIGTTRLAGLSMQPLAAVAAAGGLSALGSGPQLASGLSGGAGGGAPDPGQAEFGSAFAAESQVAGSVFPVPEPSTGSSGEFEMGSGPGPASPAGGGSADESGALASSGGGPDAQGSAAAPGGAVAMTGGRSAHGATGDAAPQAQARLQAEYSSGMDTGGGTGGRAAGTSGASGGDHSASHAASDGASGFVAGGASSAAPGAAVATQMGGAQVPGASGQDAGGAAHNGGAAAAGAAAPVAGPASAAASAPSGAAALASAGHGEPAGSARHDVMAGRDGTGDGRVLDAMASAAGQPAQEHNHGGLGQSTSAGPQAQSSAEAATAATAATGGAGRDLDLTASTATRQAAQTLDAAQTEVDFEAEVAAFAERES